MYKKIMGFLLALCVFCISIPAYAAEEISFYTPDEVVEEIDNIFRKYGVSNYCIEGEIGVEVTKYTKSEIEEQLDLLDHAIYEYSHMEKEYSGTMVESVIMPFANHENMTTYANITQGAVTVMIELSALVTWDRLPSQLGGQSFVANVSSISSRIYGTHIGTATWTQNSENWYLIGDQPTRNARIEVSGTLETSVPVLGIPITSVYDYVVGMEVQIPE